MDGDAAPDSSNDMTDNSATVLELYKTAVDAADKISARRGSANQYFLTLQTLLLGVPTLFASDATQPTDTTALAVAGLAVCAVWWLQLRSYRQLNEAKFKVINAIEARYFEVEPFSDEWTHVQGDGVKRWRERYAELGTAERFVPGVFAVLQVIVAIKAWCA